MEVISVILRMEEVVGMNEIGQREFLEVRRGVAENESVFLKEVGRACKSEEEGCLGGRRAENENKFSGITAA